MFTELKNLIEEKNIRTLFQPIVELHNGNIMGYEALSRGPAGSALENPLALLEAAEKHVMLWELETMLIDMALTRGKHFIEEGKLLFVNVDPLTVKNPAFMDFFILKMMKKHRIPPHTLVLEITERSSFTELEAFKKEMKEKSNGLFFLALDDAGSGYSSLNTMAKLKPDYIKLDLELIRGIDTDIFKEKIVTSMITFAQSAGSRIICEGIETAPELEKIVSLNAFGGQGYFLRQPQEKPNGILREAEEKIESTIYNNLRNISSQSEYHYVGKLSVTKKAVEEKTTCLEAKNIINTLELEGLCVTEKEKPVGLIMKTDLYGNLATRYGYSLYAEKSIRSIMNQRPLVIDYYTQINKALELAMLRDKNRSYDHIIVTRNGSYHGLVSIRELIKYGNEIETLYAKHLNPLTQLPGNVIINQLMEKSILLKRCSAVFYLDLDHFKSYNDLYGFEKGDEIIRLTGKIIYEKTKKLFPLDSFVGHIGGDDFFVMTQPDEEKAEILCMEIISEFNSAVRVFFSDKHLASGFMAAEDRYGSLRKTPLTSISIGGYFGEMSKFDSPYNMGEYLSVMKKKAKKDLVKKYYLEKNFSA